MSFDVALQAVVALYLVAATPFVATYGFINTTLFKAVPMVLGSVLGFFALAQFMGWPV